MTAMIFVQLTNLLVTMNAFVLIFQAGSRQFLNLVVASQPMSVVEMNVTIEKRQKNAVKGL